MFISLLLWAKSSLDGFALFLDQDDGVGECWSSGAHLCACSALMAFDLQVERGNDDGFLGAIKRDRCLFFNGCHVISFGCCTHDAYVCNTMLIGIFCQVFYLLHSGGFNKVCRCVEQDTVRVCVRARAGSACACARTCAVSARARLRELLEVELCPGCYPGPLTSPLQAAASSAAQKD